MKTSLYEKDDINNLKEMVDIDYLLDALGIKATKSSSKEVRATCIIHGGDNKSAFRFNKDKRTWVCFTHGCNETHGNDIISLIQAVHHFDFMTALNFLKELVGDVGTVKKNIEDRKFKKETEKFISQYLKQKLPEYVTEENLKAHKPLRSSYFNSKGFSNKILDRFEIAGGFKDQLGVVRDIIPIRNAKSELVAYSLRDTRKNADKDYKYVLSEGFQKDKVLYNLNRARLFGTDVPLIVVEGFKSVWRLYEYGFFNTVAIMGARLTPGQADLLKAYALNGVVLMFDPDKAGIEGMDGLEDENGNVLREGAIHMLSKYIHVDRVYMSPEHGEDPAELTSDLAYRYLNEFIG